MKADTSFDDKPVFEIRYRSGHTYKIYASGHHEGFPEEPNTLTINNIPLYALEMHNVFNRWENGKRAWTDDEVKADER
jgi:hypothetical protein